MALPRDKGPVAPEPADKEPADEESPGRVETDSRGNSVWRWARAALDSTSILLKRLENKDLAIEPTQKVPVMGGGGKADKKKSRAKDLGLADEQGSRDSHGGFDPYNSGR